MSIKKHPYWNEANRGDSTALMVVSADAAELGIDLRLCRDLLLNHEPELIPSSHYNLGLIFEKLGDVEQALAYLRKAATSDQVQFMVRYALTVRSTDPSEASKYLSRAASMGSIQAKLLLLREESARRGIWFIPVYFWKKIHISIQNAKLYSNNSDDPRIHRFSTYDLSIEETWPNWRKDTGMD